MIEVLQWTITSKFFFEDLLKHVLKERGGGAGSSSHRKREDVPDIMREMKQYKQNAGVQEQGCEALGNLALNAENQVKIAEAGGIEAIMRGMEQHRKHAGVQEQGCRALKIMGVNADNDVKIAEAGGIESEIGRAHV